MIHLRLPERDQEREKILDQAAKTGTALEINVSPQRMDLDEQWIRSAQDKGVTLVLATNSHSLVDLKNMQLGAGFARRGWCRTASVLNTQSWTSIQAFVARKQALVSRSLKA
ncbi:MAG: hypothetical protein KDD15_31425 [Lewinella sp.]|nr:hypothetical protein [Lewinella sp.]